MVGIIIGLKHCQLGIENFDKLLNHEENDPRFG